MSHFQYHVFFCTNQRPDGADCCNNHGAAQARDYMKDKCKQLNLDLDNRVRINTAGCLGRCDDGPVIVVYPEETWYTYIDSSDLDEIISEHLQNGRVVTRLQIPSA